MNREQTKVAATVMLAWAPGQEVEYKLYGDSKWRSTTCPSWNWDAFEFRIKPTAKLRLRPWTADEVPLGAWIRSKNRSWGSLIIAVRPDGTFEISDRRISPQSALEQNEHSIDGGKTWLPCGVMEEEV